MQARLLFLLLGLLGAAPLIAQDAATQTVRGRIADARTSIYLPAVRVVITSGTDSLGETQSDSTGRFHLAVKSRGSVVAHFSRVRFRSDSIACDPGSELPLRVAMVPAGGVATLAAVTVRGSGSTFERRARRSAGGTFISAADIEKHPVVRTTDLLVRVPGTSLSDSAGIIRLVSQRRLRHVAPSIRAKTDSSEYRECVLHLAVDGRLMPEGFGVNEIRPGAILGIEIYVGIGNIPVEFSSVGGDVSCGLVMVWTKAGRER
jgi:hypothetical protein